MYVSATFLINVTTNIIQNIPAEFCFCY